MDDVNELGIVNGVALHVVDCLPDPDLFSDGYTYNPLPINYDWTSKTNLNAPW